MRAFEVCLNGEKLCTAGIGDDGVVSIIVNSLVRQGEQDLFLNAAGLASRVSEHVDWISQKPLQVGDKVQVEVVESLSVDEPANRRGPMEHRKSKEDYVRKLVEDLGWKLQTPSDEPAF